MKSCPKCKSESRHRMMRKGIVKIIPGTRGYACDNCNTQYAWFSLINRTFKV